jgi:hypothetical protein
MYRFHPANLRPNVPRRPGVYKLLRVDAKLGREVLYVGWTAPGSSATLYAALAAHVMGRLRPSLDDLRKAGGEPYFEFIADADVGCAEDFQDIAACLIARHRPRLNPCVPPPYSGRYASVDVEDADGAPAKKV